MATVAEIVRAARESKGWSQEALAAEARKSKTTIQNIELGRVKPHGGTLWAIVKALGYESYERMAVAVGAVKVEQNVGDLTGGIPLLGTVPAGVGDYDPTESGADNGLAATAYIPRALIGIDDPHAFAVAVRGDSMAPQYQEGDLVFCSPQTAQESGMVAAIRFADGEATLKFVHDIGDDRLELRAANDRHPARIVHREEVVNMARVVGHYRRTYEPQ